MKAWKKELLKPWWNEYPDYLPLGAKYRGLWQKATVSRIIKELDERKLDMEVATKVFGRKIEIIEVTEYHEYGGQTEHPQIGFKIFDPEYVPGDNDPFIEEKELPNYSTDIKDAFKVVDHFKFYTGESSPDLHNWSFPTFCDRAHWVSVESETIEKAICLAALKAVEHVNK